ncbi:MAG: RNA-directed DNA polymerase [Clostridiales bacterium]|nr:RNA-directed DNA polymerase [Clostridiales bacterium]
MIQRVIADNSFVPAIMQSLIYDNGASMKNKGIDFARRRIDRHLKEAIKKWGDNFYILTYDFKNFFGSIPHATCKAILDKFYSDKRISKILMDIIKSYFPKTEERGICLGSQISQGLAVVVPNEVDHYAKDKMSFRHYMRYMDDGVAFAKTKAELKKLLEGMAEICKKLGLEFNSKKTTITKASRGFVWLKTKYNISKAGKIIKRMAHKGIVRMRRKLKKFKRKVDHGEMNLKQVYDSVQSWLAYAKGKRCHKTVKSMLKLFKRLFGFNPTRKVEVKNVLQNRAERNYHWDCCIG